MGGGPRWQLVVATGGCVAGAVQARRRGPTIVALVDWDWELVHRRQGRLTAGLCRLQRVVHVYSDPGPPLTPRQLQPVQYFSVDPFFFLCHGMAWLACSSQVCQGYYHCYYYLEGLGVVRCDAIGTCVLQRSPGSVKSNNAANQRPASAIEAIEAFSLSAIVCAVHCAC